MDQVASDSAANRPRPCASLAHGVCQDGTGIVAATIAQPGSEVDLLRELILPSALRLGQSHGIFERNFALLKAGGSSGVTAELKTAMHIDPDDADAQNNLDAARTATAKWAMDSP